MDKAFTLRVQRALLRKGFNPGELDGIPGPDTDRAIIAYKASIDLRQRPYLGPITLAALFDDVPPAVEQGDEPKWLRLARGYLGLQEYRGSRHNPQILKWWGLIRMGFTDDETPWCAGFVGGVLEECGIRSTRSAGARSYEKWGVGLRAPAVGCVVTFWRGKPQGWSGHVGFVIGRDQRRNLMVLGGNQGDAVSIKPFSVDRVTSYRWPASLAIPSAQGIPRLPVVRSDGRLSTNEA